MKPLSIITLVIALAGCASQSVTPVSSSGQDQLRHDRPAILFIKSPGDSIQPQQIIGDENHRSVLDGLS